VFREAGPLLAFYVALGLATAWSMMRLWDR
jgi:hypothetical protein